MFELCDVGADDWTVWRDLRLRALDTDPSAFRVPAEVARAQLDDETYWRRRLSTPNSKNIVGYDGDGRPAAMVSAERELEGKVHLFSMWVSTHMRGSGMADALVLAVVAWARDIGVRQLTLDVDEQNARAHNLYRRHQFEVRGTSSRPGCMRMRRVLPVP